MHGGWNHKAQGFVLWSVDIKILKNAKNIYQNKETGLPMTLKKKSLSLMKSKAISPGKKQKN